jgi:photosystem II stability/assembly factor-like uncharacterized protein
MKRILLLLFTVCIIGSADAQWGQLKNPVLSSSNYDGIIYTGTSVIFVHEGGIFRSADNGATWNLSVNGLDTNRIDAYNITFIQSRNEIWISGSGVYKSTDDGLTWTRVTLSGLNTSGWSEAISRVGNRLIILYKEWDSGLSTNIYNLCYSDNGTTWTYGSVLGQENVSRWEFIPYGNSSALYMVEEPNDDSGNKLWYSANGTSHVLHPTTGLGTKPQFRDRYLTIDPAGANLFFADQSVNKLFRYDPGTTSWSEKMNGIGGGGFTVAQTLAIHNLGAHLFSSVVLLNGSMELSLVLYYSSDNGENWSAVANPGLTFPIFEQQMVIAGSNRIIGNVFNAHIAYSDNTGQTWTRVNTCFAGEFMSLAPLPSGAIFTFTDDQELGLIKTTDNGNTWTVQNGDLPSFYNLYMIDAVFSVATTLYAVITEDPFTEKLFLYKSTNEGVNWTKITTGPDTKGKFFAGRHGTYPIIFFTDDGTSGSYQYTPDEGANWVNLSTGITPLGVDRVQGFKSNGTNLILFAEKVGKTRVYLSTNNGGSYSDITYELGASNLEIIVADKWEWRLLPNAVAGYKADGTEFYASVIDYSIFPWPVDFYKLKPTNDGWVKSGSLGVGMYNSVNFNSLRNINNVWYMLTSAGVYASIDNTATWLRVWNNEGFVKGIKIASAVINNNYFLIGTFGTGLWRAPLAAPSITTLAATSILDVSATSGATINSTGGLPFSNKGLCWATHTTPTTSDNVLFKGSSWTGFTGSMQPLLPTTTYYVRAFVQGPKGTTYGNEISFTTATTTDVESENTPGQILIYPNPVKEVMNIRTDSDYSMSLFDAIGRNVLNAPVHSGITSFQVEKLPAGLYFMKMKNSSGKIQVIRVIIK